MSERINSSTNEDGNREYNRLLYRAAAAVHGVGIGVGTYGLYYFLELGKGTASPSLSAFEIAVGVAIFYSGSWVRDISLSIKRDIDGKIIK